MRSIQHRWRRVFVPLVWLAIFQVMVVSMLASSPELHEHFHLSSHDSDHHCLATDFKAGLVEQPLVVPVVAPSFSPVDFGVVAVAAHARHALPDHLCGSLLVHGPPALA